MVVLSDGTDSDWELSASEILYTVHHIDIQNMAYSPSSITVTSGDFIIWTNLDSVDHTVTDNNTNPSFDSGLLSNGQTFALATNGLSAGTYNYHCTPHPSMTGTIIISDLKRASIRRAITGLCPVAFGRAMQFGRQTRDNQWTVPLSRCFQRR